MREIPLSLLTSAGGEGAEVVYALRNDPTLAQSILDNIGEKGQKKRKIYQRRLPENPSKDYYYIIRETNPLQSLLVEYGFIDNANDQKKLQNNLLDYVEGVVEALANYIGVPYTNEEQEEPNPSQYIVKAGDTLYSISRKFGVTVDDIKNRNNLTNNNIFIGQQLYIPGVQDVVIDPEFGTYTVKAGDTLYSIANRYGISVDDLKNYNNLNSNILSIGQELFIPTKTEDIIPPIETDSIVYIVKQGDTLYSIARFYNVPVEDIISENNLSGTILKLGQNLIIPNQTPSKEFVKYTVERGDSLYSIAKKYGVSVNEIKEENNLTSNLITIGQELRIPVRI